MSLVEASLTLRIDHKQVGQSVVDVRIPGVDFELVGEGCYDVNLSPSAASLVAEAMGAAVAAFVGRVSVEG